MRRQQVSKPRPLFEGETYLSVVALLLCGQAGQDLPIGTSHEDSEMLLVLVSYTLRVRSLTVQAPPPGVPLPLPVPVELPASIARRVLGPRSVQEPQLLLEDVSLECKPGEVLAM